MTDSSLLLRNCLKRNIIMSDIWKHIINVLFGALLVCVLAVAYLMGTSDRKPMQCKGLTITVTDSTTNQFITPKEIRSYLDKEYKGYVGKQLDNIDLSTVEKILESKSAILKSQAYTTKDSMLNVIVTQRKPIVRFQKGQKGFYADEEGILFPLQSTYASHVHIIDGEIPLDMESGRIGRPEKAADRLWLEEIMSFVNYMDGSKIWKNKIVQVTVESDGNLVLTPREGDERFMFGKPVDIEDKFRKMELYYKGIRRDKGENYYNYVDLRYDGQIVCRQNKK